MSGKLLHLGCGKKPISGFINVDIQQFDGVDVVTDITRLSDRFDADSIDLIYACHVLEHIDKRQTIAVLKDWLSVLVYGGMVRIAVPDFDSVVKWYMDTRDIASITGLTVGGNKDPFDSHKVLFNHEKLESDLEEAGFVAVRRYNWKETTHRNHDDFSQAYLPHMDKENGRLMSLNVEAIKPYRKGEWPSKIVQVDPVLVGNKRAMYVSDRYIRNLGG